MSASANRRHAGKLKWALLGVCGASACADIFGVRNAEFDASVDASTADAPADVAADVPFDGGNVNPDVNVADCGAGARTISDDAGLFVSQVGGGGTVCTLANPCAKIGDALKIVKAGETIYIAPGTYTETLEIGIGSTIEGGWLVTDAGWVPQCDNTVATVQRDPSNPAQWAVHATNGQLVTLRLLKIVNDAPNGSAPGTSVYGVLANNTPLTLDNVTVVVGDGVAGASGDPGNPGTGPSCTNINPSDGAAGPIGTSGSPGKLTPSNTGYTATEPGNGSPGTAGNNGTAGTDGGCISCVMCSMPCDAGATTCGVADAGEVCGAQGNFGCGGSGGFGGWAAGHGFNKNFEPSGGSSVAVWVWGSTLTFTNSVALRAGNAGNGGNGGDGGAPSPGAPGTPGGGNSCNTSATCGTGFTCPNGQNQCMISGTYGIGFAEAGAPGGEGGAGGPGGQGGGGAGAFSWAYFQGQNATISGAPVNVQIGLAGVGGNPNGPDGATGQHN
jgi:hypothetical protein